VAIQTNFKIGMLKGSEQTLENVNGQVFHQTAFVPSNLN
jgi:hypothetical protein